MRSDHIRNPVELARAVMEQSEYVMLTGAGAEEFALSQRLRNSCRKAISIPPERWQQLRADPRRRSRHVRALTISHVGTVGAVALDDRAVWRPPPPPAA